MHITRGVRNISDAQTNVFTIVVHDKVRINDAKRRADEIKLALHNIINKVNDVSAEDWAMDHARHILKAVDK